MHETTADPHRRPAGPLPVPPLPPRLLMDLAEGVCNLRCPKCYVFGMSDAKTIKSLRGDMSLETARRILDEVMAVKPIIQPTLWSESLMARNFREHITAMKAHGAAVAINTNGLLLDEDVARFFVDVKLDALSISIDAITVETLMKVRATKELNKIEEAVRIMLRVRGDKPHPRVCVTFAVEKENAHERDAFVEKWLPVADAVRVTGVYTLEGGIKVPPALPARVPCMSLYETMPIHHDGEVSICCLDVFRQERMGNVLKDGVKGVWLGEKFQQVRHYHETGQYDKVPFCKNCDVWASYLYTEEVKDNVLIRRSPLTTYYNRIDRAHTELERVAGSYAEITSTRG
jgi:radical SAM protein with 4Fe4S-binding SPASM domain